MKLLFQQFVFFIQRRVGDSHIVGIDGHGDTTVEEYPDGMLGKGRDSFGLDIARWTHFQNDLLFFQ